MSTHTYIAYPTGKRINPSAPETGFYFSPGQVHYILEVDGKLRDFTSHGTFGLAIGEWVEMKHDQTSRFLGMAKVIGIRFADGTTEGQIPTKSIPHWVAK